MSKMTEAMGIKPYVIQKCMDRYIGPWVPMSDQQFDTLEEAQAALEKLAPQVMYRIAEAIPYMQYEPVLQKNRGKDTTHITPRIAAGKDWSYEPKRIFMLLHR